MVGTDPIADMLTRVRNASSVGKTQTSIPFSKLKLAVAETIKKAGYFEDVKTNGEGISREIIVEINAEDQSPAFTELKRLSKPGRRVYSAAQDMPRVKSGRGMVVVSTSNGVMSGEQARKQKVGGELICSIY